MPEELCQVSPKSHNGVLASHSDPSPLATFSIPKIPKTTTYIRLQLLCFPPCNTSTPLDPRSQHQICSEYWFISSYKNIRLPLRFSKVQQQMKILTWAAAQPSCSACKPVYCCLPWDRSVTFLQNLVFEQRKIMLPMRPKRHIYERFHTRQCWWPSTYFLCVKEND